MEVVNAVKKSMPVLMPERMGLSEDKHHDWVVDLPLTVTLEQALEPSFWAHVAAQMEPLDHIEVRSEDGSWIAFLIVSFCERNYAKVVLDRKVVLNDDHEVPISTVKHKVEWKGPHLKWCVIRVADSQPLQQGMRDKQTAFTWMTEHEKTLAR